ncbi:MAG: TonB-dependent receptor, partial [Calditrichaeota bacterium]|nr:TonB-dependent receptor [Calditrichota bacterium]
ESPAGNELDNFPTSSSPNILINPDLKAQKSRNFELGIKGNLLYRGTSFFNNIYFEGTFFNSVIDDEIVPFE